MNNIYSQHFLQELETEMAASRKCVERVDPKFYSFKPHEKSMEMGYLASIVAEVPRWISESIKKGEINFATWEKYKLTTAEEMTAYFDKNMEEVRKVLAGTTDEALEKMFYLKAGEQVLMQDTLRKSVSDMIRHWVHHRGQLSVYLRLCGIAVPSIYGPSADDKTF